ncbi:MarR family transcriptional regulator [Ensifer sp. SSB1]|uniref:MarR family winged helix-turn-helix transcriptional regulator n=1 Tax=Ensifer sp. SSB1 TaxID=2795385 RepID=UPI001A488C69|nr:MarR family transcriptional regulator [Ensifer sp. SSB1]MBK5570925.1 MarR family transcriptional regulator [Ensifer sp. SSB1]
MPSSVRVKPAASVSGANSGEPLDPGVFSGLAGVRLAMRRFLASSEIELSRAGITSQQYQALLVIKTAPQNRIRMRGLAEEMLMQHNGAVQLVDRLEAAGLVHRAPSPVDKRSVLVGLTVMGEAALDALARRHLVAMLANEPLLAESLTRLRELAQTR